MWTEGEKMWTDILLQAGMILVTVFMFLFMHDIPKKLLSKFRYRNTTAVQAKRHFVMGAQLLAKARSAKTRSSTASIAGEAVAEADKAIALDPKDAAAHILKALALDLQGFRTSAIDSFDAALSPLAMKSLSDEERGDALFRRAELKVGLSRHGRVDSAVEDLTQAVKLSKEHSGRAYSLLGECYEVKEMKDEAVKAYEEAIRIDSDLKVAREALDRLRS